jgi:type IV pilus assembly protein PilN
LSSEQAQTQEGNHTAAQMLAPGAVQFEILSGYNPLPAKPVKEVSTKKDTESNGPKVQATKKPVARKTPLPRGVVKAPAQKGAPR